MVVGVAPDGLLLTRIGIVLVGPELLEGTRAFQTLLDGLAARGHEPGLTVELDVRRPAANEAERTVTELLAVPPDLIIEHGSAHAARAATASSVPVIVWSPQPIQTGLVTDLDRPGGNVTGITFVPGRIKSILELIRTVLPTASRVAVLVNLTYPPSPAQLRDAQAAAPEVGIELEPFEVVEVTELDAEFERIASRAYGAVYVQNHPIFNRPAGAQRIAALGLRYGIPVISHYESIVRAGGLIGTPPDFVHWAQHVADYADRILRGTLPGDLPFEQSVPQRIIVNLATARALNVSFGVSIAGAAELIES